MNMVTELFLIRYFRVNPDLHFSIFFFLQVLSCYSCVESERTGGNLERQENIWESKGWSREVGAMWLGIDR